MGYKINVKNCKRASVTADTSSSYTIATPVAMPAIRSIDISFKTASGELYGDGEVVSNISLLTGATLKLDTDKLTLADRAAFMGSTLTADGILDVATTDKPPKMAIYAEMEHDDGGYEAVWLLVGRAEPANIGGQQKEQQINYSTDTININFIRREKDKKLLRLADTDDANFTTAKQTAFASSPDLA